MPTYSYRAVTDDGELNEGQVEAASERAVVDQLAGQGLVPLYIEPVAASGGGRRTRLPWRRDKVGRNEIGVITQELAAMLQAGLQLDRSLEILSQIADNQAVAELAIKVRDDVRGGSSLADALEATGVFSRFYVNMVRAGEAGGSTETALARLNEYLERSKALRETVISALIYPSILFGVAVLSVVILLTFVVPQFETLFSDMGKALPLPTRIVMGVGDAFRSYWWLLLGLVLLSAAGVRAWLRDPDRRRRLDARVLHWPVFGDLISKVETARFARTLATLLQNGVPMLTALGIVQGTLSNRRMAETAGASAGELKEGRELARSLLDSGAFPAFAAHLIRVGEETGRLEEMLEQVAQIYDNEVQAAVKRMLSLVEPVLILGLGVIIAAIIMSILVAILGVNELAF